MVDRYRMERTLRLRIREGGARSYTWVRNKLRVRGEGQGPGKHRRKREPAPWPGVMLHQDGSA